MITITGTAQTISAGGTAPAAGVLVEAFANADENTVITSATTDAAGSYSLTVTTNGVALDGFLKATKSGLLVTYLYPDRPLAEDFDGASINMISQSTFDILAGGLFCDANQDPAKGTIAALVFDANQTEVGGAMLSTTPAASTTCYNGNNSLPDGNATMTAADGIGYLFNVTGTVQVSATATGMTFPSHAVVARAGALTTTLVRP